MRILVTGSVGFIGYHVTSRLLSSGHSVFGIDSVTNYYDPSLKEARLAQLAAHSAYEHSYDQLESMEQLRASFSSFQPDIVIHLAAQAGVRYALEEPRSYVNSNIVGTFNILEATREFKPKHLLLASTSSVYGANSTYPYIESQRTDHPMSFYSATKKATEDMAHAYSHLHDIPTTVFRFFTVYGSWGRPDMAIFKFTEAALRGTPIQLHDGGRMKRDFTHVVDLVRAIELLIESPPIKNHPRSSKDSLSPVAPYRTVNIGGGKPITVVRFIEAIENATGRSILRTDVPSVPGEVPITSADCSLLFELTGFQPTIDIDSGVREFVDWLVDYGEFGQDDQ